MEETFVKLKMDYKPLYFMIVSLILFIIFLILVILWNINYYPLLIYLWVFAIGFFIEAIIIRFRKKFVTSLNDFKCAWEIYKTCDTLIHDRTNYFLVAESMLLFSFVTSLSNEIRKNLDFFPEQWYLSQAIGVVGLIITFLFYFNIRRIRIRMNFLQYILEKNNIWKGYTESVIKWAPSGQFMLTSLLPLVIFFLWWYILFYSLNWSMYDVIIVYMPVIIFVFMWIRACIELFLPKVTAIST